MTDKYLDASRFIRELEEAERLNQIDNRGVIEELEKAVKHCTAEIKVQEGIIRTAREFSVVLAVAKGQYFAEIKRRVALPHGGDPKAMRTPEKIGWRNWCIQNHFSPEYTNRLLKIAEASNPAEVYERLMINQRYNPAATTYRRLLQYRKDSIKANVDPLAKARNARRELSRVQAREFAFWLIDSLPWTDQEALADYLFEKIDGRQAKEEPHNSLRDPARDWRDVKHFEHVGPSNAA